MSRFFQSDGASKGHPRVQLTQCGSTLACDQKTWNFGMAVDQNLNVNIVQAS